MIMVVHALEAAETVHHAAAFRAEQIPVHRKQAERGGVQEEIDHLRLGDILFLGEGEGIDAVERPVVGGADMAFKLRDQPR